MSKDNRVFSIKEQLRNIYFGAKGFVMLRTSKKSRIINKKFKERIMLAITEVNGCSMCSFVHTKLALQIGMSKEEIKQILDGDTSDIPLDDAVAVLFAQNFAYSKENPSVEAIRRIVEEYGVKKSELILAASNMITFTNGMGTSMDYLYERMKFKRNKKSNILLELFNPLLSMSLFPVMVLYFFVLHLIKGTKFINEKKLIAS